MKRNYIILLTVIFIISSVFFTCGSVAATKEAFKYNKINVSVNGMTKIKNDVPFIAPNGREVPATISYQDNSGGVTNYISVRKVAEILGLDVAWNEKTQNVNFSKCKQDKEDKDNKNMCVEIRAEKQNNFSEEMDNAIHFEQTNYESTVSFERNTKIQKSQGNTIDFIIKNQGPNTIDFNVSVGKNANTEYDFTVMQVSAGTSCIRTFKINENEESQDIYFTIRVDALSGPVRIEVNGYQYDSSTSDAQQESVPVIYDYDGIKTSLYAVTSQSISLFLENLSNQELAYDEAWGLEKNTDRGWIACSDDGVAVIAIEHHLDSNKKVLLNYNWSDRYGELPPGLYRIKKLVKNDNGKYEILCDFSIK